MYKATGKKEMKDYNEFLEDLKFIDSVVMKMFKEKFKLEDL
jgi:hypothetical protein